MTKWQGHQFAKERKDLLFEVEFHVGSHPGFLLCMQSQEELAGNGRRDL
jgi:hypothetical protein